MIGLHEVFAVVLAIAGVIVAWICVSLSLKKVNKKKRSGSCISIHTTRYSALIRRLFEEYCENVDIFIEGNRYTEKDIGKLLEWWCKNEAIKGTVDFSLHRDGVDIFGFHDTPDDFWAAMSERFFVEQLAKEKIIRCRIYPHSYEQFVKNKRTKSGSLFSKLTFLAFFGFGLSVINASLTCCICGHLDFVSLPGSLIGTSVAWYAMVRTKNVGVVIRVVIDAACIATTLILLKNGWDILWLGHDPLLL